MADITKCEGVGCPIKKTCYRFKALENEFRQAWFTKTPGEKVDGEFKCDHYWKLVNSGEKQLK